MRRSRPMPDRDHGPSASHLLQRYRCRCGHLPTHHMSIAPIGDSGNFRLLPLGPCELCGPGLCPAYVPAPPRGR